MSSGFEVRKERAPIPVPDKPQSVKVNPAKHDDELEVIVKPVRGAKAYIYRMYVGTMSAEPIIMGASLKGRFIAGNLNSITRYWFQSWR
ncbi:MAG: hypothetical protein IPP77_12080 [Bacteroidetes bacterium]|nr:hypothetical protein [Bacteroidota bacterium]